MRSGSVSGSGFDEPAHALLDPFAVYGRDTKHVLWLAAASLALCVLQTEALLHLVGSGRTLGILLVGEHKERDAL